MKIVPLEDNSIDYYLSRLRNVSANSHSLWGFMDSVHVMAHLRRTFEISLSEMEVAYEGTKSHFVNAIVIWITFRLLPWPKGKLRTHPMFLPDNVDNFEAEKEAASKAMKRFAKAASVVPGKMGISPIFGPLPFSQWAVIHGRHLDHHLKQFGA